MHTLMVSIDEGAADRLHRLRAVSGRGASAIVRLLIAQADVRTGARLTPVTAGQTAHLLVRAGLQARRLDELCRAARATRSAIVRQLLTQCPVPALPDLRIPPAISVVRLPNPPSAPHNKHTKRFHHARHNPSLTYVHALLREPENEDVYQRLSRLAAATNRTIAEALRLIIMQAQVTLPTDIHLQDGPVIVRIERNLP